MSRKEMCVLTNMCMIEDSNGNVVVQKRNDKNWPGIIFPGGHIEPRESIVASVVREVFEETGLSISDLKICGVRQFTSKDNSYRYIVFLFKTNKFSGNLQSSDEGEVFWVKKNELSKYELTDGFLEILEVFEKENVNENYHWFDGNWFGSNY